VKRRNRLRELPKEHMNTEHLVERNGSVVKSKRRIKALRATLKSTIGFLSATLRQSPEHGPTIESSGLVNSPLIHNVRLFLSSGHHVRQTAGNR